MNKELTTKIEALCQDIENQHFKSYPSLKEYGCTFKAGRKFCKIIITDGNGGDRSVWRLYIYYIDTIYSIYSVYIYIVYSI